MEITRFEDKHIDEVVSLWNKLCKTEMLYKPFNKEGFINKFINNQNFSYDGTFVGIEDGKVIGFANSIFKKIFLPGETFENTPGYITIILVDEKYRRRGYGTRLLKSCEQFLKNSGKKMIDINFFNPINLEWYIPGTDKHDHPNAPGVDVAGAGYGFLKRNGYTERAKEAAMYLDLKQFEISDDILQKIGELKDKGIEICYYDKNKHYGFDDLFTNLKHELWRKEINDNLNQEHPDPVIIAADKGKICGFTGPIKLQRSGRGLFSGIGVDPQYRGEGIGKALFFVLCDSFKKEGAKFMSIFTGVDNNAKRMYDAAGFNVVRIWALFRKEI